MWVFCECTKPSHSHKKKVTFGPEYTVYGTMSCGYTVKMVKHLKDIGKNFKFVDVNENKQQFEKVLEGFGVQRTGVPFNVHEPSSTYFIGYKQVQ